MVTLFKTSVSAPFSEVTAVNDKTIIFLLLTWGKSFLTICACDFFAYILGGNGVNDGQKTVPQFSCTFETDYCGWSNDSRGDFYWIRNKGRTPSDETGPPWDHTTQSKILSNWKNNYIPNACCIEFCSVIKRKPDVVLSQ